MKNAARTIEILIGSVFLVAGASKVWDPILFYWSAFPYATFLKLSIEIAPKAAQLALLLGPFECALGLALIVRWRPKQVFPVTIGLLTFFAFLTFSAWRQGQNSSCGCFGTLLERGPLAATAENLIMIGFLVFAWTITTSSASIGWAPGKYLVMGGTLLAFVFGGVRFFPEMERLKNSDLQAGVMLTGLSLDGTDLEIHQGSILVEIFDPTCERCKDAVLKLNQLAQFPGFPPIVALTFYPRNSPPLKDFVNRFKPTYTIATVSKKDLLRLTFGHKYPRLALLKNGKIQAVWEYNEFPSQTQLETLLHKSS